MSVPQVEKKLLVICGELRAPLTAHKSVIITVTLSVWIFWLLSFSSVSNTVSQIYFGIALL